MSAKFIHVIADENRELQRQIGCMTGIFQIFDSQRLVTTKRLIGHSHNKRLPSGHASLNIGNVSSEHYASSAQVMLEKNHSKSSYENQRIPMEPSRTSFSSSSCSSFSSLECNKSTQHELPSFDRAVLKASPKLKTSENESRPIIESSKQSLNFRDVVKDSIYRESSGVSVKASAREEVMLCVSKHRDSPRPTQLSKPVDHNESLRVLVKLKEAGELRRSSYDGREISGASLDSREHSKPASKLREIARLSLDSKDRSLRGSNYDTKPNLVSKDLGSGTTSHQKEPGTYESSPSLVAKLMGLEVMPNSMELSKSYSRKDCDFDFITKSLDSTRDIKQDRLFRSPDSSLKDSVLTRPVSNSWVPIETAPWRNPKATPRNLDPRVNPPAEIVYGEIEQRLKDLESNKDLRALKQILDSMQAKGLLESKRGKKPDSELLYVGNERPTVDDQNSSSENVGNRLVTHPLPTMTKGSNSPRPSGSPIVIMKPAKSVNGPGFSSSSIIPLAPRNINPADKRSDLINKRASKAQTPRSVTRSREKSSPESQSRSLPASLRPQKSVRENIRGSAKTSSSTFDSLSPRLQQRKLDAERKLKPGNRQQSDPVTSRNKLRRGPSQAQDNDLQLSESSETTNPSLHGDEVSLRSDSNISVASHVDVEVTSVDLSENMNLPLFRQSGSSPSTREVNMAPLISKQKGSSFRPNEDVPSSELANVAPEQPSPISVLDASFDRDEFPRSPLKKSYDAYKDEGTRPSDDLWNPTEVTEARIPKLCSKIDHKKLENIENLVRKLRDLSSNDAGPPNEDHIASLCETQNPDHRYVSEVLLASGILMKDLTDGPMGSTPIHLHPSGHPINPDLFLVLEQTNSGPLSKPESKPDKLKIHRKLVFDVVNEILTQKQMLRPGTITGGFPTGQRLLREVCSEIERLQAENSRGENADDGNMMTGEDLLRQLDGWNNNFNRGRPGLVLEIERSIFKDLIDEIVSGGDAPSFSKSKSSRRRRQLFTK